MDDVEIIGASDIIPGKARAFLDEFGLTDVPAFEKNADLLALKPDGVSVCTYNTQHHTCACEAMEAGVNVLCEKPMSVTLDQAVEMAKCQKKTGKILTIGFQPRYGENMKMIAPGPLRRTGPHLLHPDRRRPPQGHSRTHLRAEGSGRRGLPGGHRLLRTGHGAERGGLSQARHRFRLCLRLLRKEPQVLRSRKGRRRILRGRFHLRADSL